MSEARESLLSLLPVLNRRAPQSVSTSADLYHTFGNVQTNLLVEGFFTDLSDVFALRQLDGLDAQGNAVLGDITAREHVCWV